MANICCDDVYFYSDKHPERLQELRKDLESSLIFDHSPEHLWIGNLFEQKGIQTDSISLRGTVEYMECSEDSIYLALSVSCRPLYEAYEKIADAYGLEFVLKGMESGCNIYINTDFMGYFFPEQYCIKIEDESSLTPSGIPICRYLEDEDQFDTKEALIMRLADAGYQTRNWRKLLSLLAEAGNFVYHFQNPYPA